MMKQVKKEENTPPMNPSTVFLGDNLIRGVFPKNTPKKYAPTSFSTTDTMGNTNQKLP
jgi:hypothetical protein